MTRERMNRLLESHPGIGVVSTDQDGNEICYFYEDFDGPASGIARAMKQLYPLQDKGIIKTLCFVEQYKKNAE